MSKTSLNQAGAALAAAILCAYGAQECFADKLCVKMVVSKSLKTKVTKKIAATCPSGFTELADTSVFKGSTGATGATGPTGADGSIAVYGDGSAGALTVASNTTLNDGNTQFTDVTINNGVTLNVVSGTIIRCSGTFTNNGTITVFKGARGGSVYRLSTSNYPTFDYPGAGLAVSPASFGEIGTGTVYGGTGGRQIGGFLPGLVKSYTFGGGGGAGAIGSIGNSGAGGSGGGFVGIYARGAVTIGASGLIEADGEGAGSGGGGGGGGVIILASQTSVANSGLLRARGGTGGPSNNYSAAGGGGGGGLIHILAPSTSVGTTEVTGGSAGNSSTSVSQTNHSGGGGGGGGASQGGGGGAVSGTSSSGASPGQNGYTLSSQVDPTSRLL